jgi:predicted LPLAT superfamily acyltransferase
MSEWKGQSRGKVIGYRIFGWTLKYLGLGFAYFLLKFVSAYFVFTSHKAFRSLFYYFHHRLGYGRIKSIISIFRNYYLFGQVLIDKTAVLAGFRHNLEFHLEGKEELLAMKDGGILISGHIGNWEVGGQVLDFLNKKINILVFDQEKEAIKQYQSQVLVHRNVSFITIENDLSHLIEIKRALENKEIIAMHGDRHLDGNKTLEINFLGEPALFPAGPWQMAQYLDKPVSYVFAVKETPRKYRFFATSPRTIGKSENYGKRDVFLKDPIQDYVAELEKITRRYPLQWYNYFDFWKK